MFTISLANPKGGAGKTTTARIIADTAHAMGHTVAVFDCDPLGNFKDWADHRTSLGMELPYHVRPHRDVTSLVKDIDALEATGEVEIAIIDPEGSANEMISAGLSRADVALITLNPSYMDARQAIKAAQLTKDASALYGRDIPALFAFTSMVKTAISRDTMELRETLVSNGANLLDVPLFQLAAYREIFTNGLLLSELKNKDRRVKAMANAETFTRELLAKASETKMEMAA